MPKTLQNGSFVDANGTAVANGTLVLTLSQDAQIIAGGNVDARNPIAITLDSNGDVTGSPSVYGQDELNPGGTYYFAEVLNSGGSSVWGQTKWVISGASPINLDLMVPTLLNPDPAYSQPVLQNPVADQTIKSFNLNPAAGNTTQSLGSLAAPWTASLNKVIKYNGIATAGAGMPAILGAVDLTGQNAAIAATNIYFPTVTQLYRVSAYLKVTTAAGVSSTLGAVTITYLDGDATSQSQVMQMQTEAGAAATTNAGNNISSTKLSGTLTIFAGAGLAIQFAIAYASNAASAMQYEAHFRCEAL